MKSKSLFYLFAVAALVLAMVSCEKENPPASQEILFHSYYINFAWGYDHSGFFIDKNGNIKTYAQRGQYNNSMWNFPDDDCCISEDKMKENLEQTELSDVKIDFETLQKYAAKIYSVKYDDYTEAWAACDMGAIVNVCYLFNEKTKMYKPIILSQDGDWTRINNNSVAKEIDNWLKTIILN